VDSIGESYEVFAESVLSRIATLTRIGTKQDFGTDIYCLPRISTGDRTDTVTELCLLQVKGGHSPLTYGGIEKGQWKCHEFDWLRSLWAPLYLATVDREYRRVDLFSLWPIWWVMWQCPAPYKIICSPKEPAGAAHTHMEPTRQIDKAGAGYGDGQTWTVDLGPPILRLTHESLNDDAFQDSAILLFRRWIQCDRITVARFHEGVSVVEAILCWETNKPIPGHFKRHLAWDTRPGMNIERVASAFVPSLLALGVHLQHQDNEGAYRLIPALEWVQENGFGNEMTKGLLDGLLKNKLAGLSPRPH